jgi:hypothetical protein
MVVLVLHVAHSDFGLKIAAELNSIRRIDIDHLDFAGEVLAAGKG